MNSDNDNVDTCNDNTCEKEKNVFDYIKKVKNGEGSCIDETSTTTTNTIVTTKSPELDNGISQKLFEKYINNLNALLGKMVTVCALPKSIHGWIYEYSEGIENELEDQILVQEKYDKTANKLDYSKTGVVTNRPCYDFTQCDALGTKGPLKDVVMVYVHLIILKDVQKKYLI